MENNLKIGDSVRCFSNGSYGEDIFDGFIDRAYIEENQYILKENGWAFIKEECKNIRILLLEKKIKKNEF